MKRYLLVLVTILMSFSTINENPIDRINVKGPLNFQNKNFELSWSDNPNDTYYIQEYLPKGEKSESFNEMLTIHLFNKPIKVKDAVAQKIKELKERKKTDPTCNYKVTESPDGKEFMVDFLLADIDGDEVKTVEFNIYRYKEVDLGKNQKGILVYAYSKRSYGSKITKFYETLAKDRTELLNEMISSDMPNVKLAEK